MLLQLATYNAKVHQIIYQPVCTSMTTCSSDQSQLALKQCCSSISLQCHKVLVWMPHGIYIRYNDISNLAKNIHFLEFQI